MCDFVFVWLFIFLLRAIVFHRINRCVALLYFWIVAEPE